MRKKRYGDVWAWDFAGWYCFKLDGVRTKLCKIAEGKDKAEETRASIIAADQQSPIVAAETYSDRKVSSLVAEYLEAKKGSIADKTLRDYKSVLTRFVAQFGNKTATTLDCADVANWVKGQVSWATGGQFAALKAIRLSMSFHVGSKKLLVSPLAGLKLPKPVPRADDCVFRPGEYEAILDKCPAWLSVLVGLLYRTGARPDELCGLLKDEMDWRRGFAEKRSHKTAHKGQRRFIRFSSEDMELLECLSDESEDEYLLHGRDGGHLYVSYCGERFRDAVSASDIPERRKRHLTMYSCRHTFIVDHIEAGTAVARIASLVGHKGTRMIESVYGHFIERCQYGQGDDDRLAAFRASK